MNDTQKRIYEAVKARGYRADWSAEQFLARNVCKAVEELYEVAHWTRAPIWTGVPRWIDELSRAACVAEREFDSGEFPDYHLANPDEVAQELADVYVTLMCAAEALGEITGEDVDLEALALAKAERDVPRGVRQ